MKLPRDLESAIFQILDGPDDSWSAGLDELCAAHPENADAIRAQAAQIQREFGEGRTSATGETPSRIGPYRILGTIGSGGMGTVYRAEQTEPVRRDVALKVIKLGMDSKSVVARFQQERQALALMEHEGIAKVFDCGTTERGQPWFAMELVRGVSIDRYCDERQLPIEERLELIQQVCAAVQHAHHKAIVHRDLKPGNVLVVEHEGQRQIKIIDFGLAKAMGHKLVEATMFTEAGMMVGTPEFMAPEQADPTNPDIDTRADIYAVGVILYQLLAGALPFSSAELRKAGLAEARRILREVEPPKPSSRLSTANVTTAELARTRRTSTSALRRALSNDLDWVVMMAMAKERNRRYVTASALADDLRRYLDNEPVLAGPPSALYRLQKLWKRRRGQVMAAALVALALVAGGVATLAQWLRAEQTVGEYELLSGVVKYEDTVANERTLYPAWPHKIAAMERWLAEDCGALMAMIPVIERTLDTLRAQAFRWTDEERHADETSHPRYDELLGLQKQLDSLQYAQHVRTETQPLEVPELDEDQRSLSAQELANLAYERVALNLEGRRVWGEEPIALAYARLAVTKASEEDNFAYIHSVLAIALLANGQIADAKEQNATTLTAVLEALDQDPNSDPTYRRFTENEARKVEEAANQFDSRLSGLEANYRTLAAEVRSRRTWTFPPDKEAQRFLHRALVELLTDVRTLAKQLRPAVEARLRWARRIGDLTRNHPRAYLTWEQAREQLRESARYEGFEIDLREEDMLGLVPLGINRETGFLEFYHLRSAWDGEGDPADIEIPRHDDQGRIVVGDDTGIVFVLLPGGSTKLGAQKENEDLPYYDPDMEDYEFLTEVRLDPFLIARHELTRGQWLRQWTGAKDMREPSFRKIGETAWGRAVTANMPVGQVPWGAGDTLMTDLGLTLPTEAQWEYACRGATNGARICELDELQHYGNIADATASRTIGGHICESWDDGFAIAAPVGSFRANDFGLYDVLGNVNEWCRDIFDGNRKMREGDGLAVGSVKGRTGRGGTERVWRGGSFYAWAAVVCSARRGTLPPDSRLNDTGMRASRALHPSREN